MKRVIQTSREMSHDAMHRYLDTCVRNIANYAYNNANLSDDDPRCDYFVENIVEDPEVVSKKAELLSAIESAIDSQLRR